MSARRARVPGTNKPGPTAAPGAPSCCQGSARASRRHSSAGPKCKHKPRGSGQSADPGLASNAEGRRAWGRRLLYRGKRASRVTGGGSRSEWLLEHEVSVPSVGPPYARGKPGQIHVPTIYLVSTQALC